MKWLHIHRDALRRLVTGATKEDRRLRVSIAWSAALVALILLWRFV
jgi:hypothetical protein